MCRMLRVSALFVLSVYLLSWGQHAVGQPKKVEPTVMQRKLQHAQGVLNGLVQNDFEKISQHADGLLKAREDATWRINETERYLRYSNTFVEQLQDLKKASKNKNLDGATLAYVEMTLSCVKCHEALRVGKAGKRNDD